MIGAIAHDTRAIMKVHVGPLMTEAHLGLHAHGNTRNHVRSNFKVTSSQAVETTLLNLTYSANKVLLVQM